MSGELESLIKACWEQETREALQDVSGATMTMETEMMMTSAETTRMVEQGVPRIDRRKSRKGLVSKIRLGMLMQPSKEM